MMLQVQGEADGFGFMFYMRWDLNASRFLSAVVVVAARVEEGTHGLVPSA